MLLLQKTWLDMIGWFARTNLGLLTLVALTKFKFTASDGKLSLLA